ncbi:hypothetical protein BJQ94_10400 [Cryobacterium sp. SO2]|uniref:hypothetical protein n=1 Tax=Cryobacterium sp. SO2 TaxID=1897060 RepID=UPI00223CD35D|nr:hypothetical protein [Cryobacterium sp. SO2]WEO75796.1 hypothetical protein BJQ94_10400 [Cryobacterium sp. SO2]
MTDPVPEGLTRAPSTGPVSWSGRARGLLTRLPTRWLVTGSAAGLLGLSALFGGLDAAPVEAAPVVAVGDSHVGSELTVTVSQALLIDAFPEQLLMPEEGNRLLVVRAVVENTTTEPRRLGTAGSVSATASSTTAGGKKTDTIGLSGVPGVGQNQRPLSILVIDDGSGLVVVQPGVPVELAFVWEVAGDALTAGDPVRVELFDRVFISEGRLTYGGLYDDPVVTATVNVVLDDVGAGASE